MHAYVYKSSPRPFDNTWITVDGRDAASVLRNNNLFEISHPRIEMFKRSPLYTLPNLWNDLNECKFYANSTTFKLTIRNLLLEQTD
jgi:hypothetical protein